jgi:hypothetical protein
MSRSTRILCLAILIQAVPSWGQSGSVIVDGKEWLQPKDFVSYSYNQVSEVCPEGVCTGKLPGSKVNLTGYIWASIDDAESLFSYYSESRRRILEDFAYTYNDADPDTQTIVNIYLVAMLSELPEFGTTIAYVYGKPPPTSFEEETSIQLNPFTQPSESNGEQGAWFWRYNSSDSFVNLSGNVESTEGTQLCAMVLASGKYDFSCNPNGPFSLTNLSRESNGTVKRQVYVDGFFPKVEVLEGSGSETVVMQRSGECPNYNTPYSPSASPGSAGKRVDIRGSVLLGNSGTPLCAMVLANGEYVFSCDGSGNYNMNIPLDAEGQFKLQVYADGFAPYTSRYDEVSLVNDAQMARASECN